MIEIKIPGTQLKLEVSERNDAILANNALKNAHNQYPDLKPLYHSDQGSAYASRRFKNLLENYGMTQSISRVLRCIDNGPCESFQGRFKRDLIYSLS